MVGWRPASMFNALRSCATIFLLGYVLTGCGDPLYLGSNMVWSSRLESGDLSEWRSDPLWSADLTDLASLQMSQDQVHTGRYALAITRQAGSAEGGPAIGHAASLPNEAYYGAWFYIPSDYPVTTYWTILQLRAVTGISMAVVAKGDELRLRKLPSGDFALYLFSNDPNILQSPLSDPPALVPVGRWFHLEAFFRLGSMGTGSIQVWLDGRLVYDFGSRTVGGKTPWFGISSVSEDSNFPLKLLVDDVTASLARATPHELLDPP